MHMHVVHSASTTARNSAFTVLDFLRGGDGLFLACRDLGEVLAIHSPPTLLF